MTMKLWQIQPKVNEKRDKFLKKLWSFVGGR